MCRNDEYIDEINPPNELAKKKLIQKIQSKKVNRYYTRAKCLNSAETKNLDVKLQSINNTQDEFQRAYSADERLFKMGRRRYISGLQNVSVSSEINYLNDKRRLSSVIPSLDVNLEHLERYQGDNTSSDGIEMKLPLVSSPLPNSTISALHEGIPTQLTMPNIQKRIKTAPIRRNSDLSIASSTPTLDPIQLLVRVGTSHGFRELRERIARKDSRLQPCQIAMRKPSSSYPTYLALNTVEHNSIRADQKQQVINKWKSVHAGSDERCSEMVKKWIADEKYVFVK